VGVIFPLRLKLALVTSVLLGFAIGTVSLLVLRQSRDALEGEARKRGAAIARSLAGNARVPLLEQDDVVLGQLLETISQEAEILGARVLDADGNIVAAAGSQMPQSARPLSAEEHQLTRATDGHLLISSAITFNDVDVGDAQIILDLEGLIAPVVERARRDVMFASGALLLTGVLLAISISARTTRPLRRLRLAVNALAAGDLSARVEPTTRDEVADLTRAFNEMSESLSQKQRVETAFRRYVSDHVLREVLDSPESVALKGERREVTVVFIDIRNFTRLTGQLGPERLVAFLNEAFDIITSRLLEHGATVDKYIGDAILAYFGAPIETPDHPERSVAAAIAIQRSVDERNRKQEADGDTFVRLELGIGIHTGTVVVGNIGSELKMDYTAIGDPVNLANRIQNLARAGEILVTTEVARRLGSRVKLETLGMKRLPGRDAPVETHRVLY
jgi:adenylate cyclase